MIRAFAQMGHPLFFALAPEQAHRAAIAALAWAPAFPPPAAPDPRLAVSAFGLTFANPIGMAAGFDKDAEAVAGLFALGFGFVEVGTLTPLPQDGNPRPRLFRLIQDRALINRLGFNNRGFKAARERLAARRMPGVVGVNIGPNRDSTDRIGDFVRGIATFADLASYFTINVSSPNTPGLRDLQKKDSLDALIARALEAREACAARRPLLIKISPDLDLAALDDIVAVARARRLDGMIVSNTTTARPAGLVDPAASQAGGLSGRPLFHPSTRLLAETFLRVEGAFPLIGCGGVDSAATAYAKVRAGASLVQLYTGLIYRGPLLVEEIVSGLPALLDADRRGRLAEAIGADAAALVAGDPLSASGVGR
jgi:dihydroorotate dehydrogenase